MGGRLKFREWIKYEDWRAGGLGVLPLDHQAPPQNWVDRRLSGWTSRLGFAEFKSPSDHLRKGAADYLRAAVRYLLIDRLAGSPLVPGVLRFQLLRALGFDVHTTFVQPGFVIEVSELYIGPRCGIGPRQTFMGGGRVHIGRDTMIGPEGLFITANHDRTEETINRNASFAPIHIGERCWLSSRVTVLPGVTIGDDVVIGAGAVVSSDCEPGWFYAGVPARKVKPNPQVAESGELSGS